MNNSNPLKFALAKENDLDSILNIYNYYIVNTTATFDFGEISLEELRNRIFIDHHRYKTFLINVDNESAGFCFLTQFRQKQAYDDTVELGLYLKPRFTGRGLGAKIVEFMENIAKENRFRMIIVSISGENTQSLKLFGRLGYTKCAHYKEIAVKFGRKMDIVDFQKTI